MHVSMLLCPTLVATAQTPPPECQAGRGGMIYARGGTVSVEILPGNPSAVFISEIRLLSPGPVRTVGTNRQAGTVVDLGSFPQGTELVFGIVVNDIFTPGTFTYSMGAAARNPDGTAHADVACLGDSISNISFEDGQAGGDGSYDDVRFRVRASSPASMRSVVFEEIDAPVDGNPQDFGGGSRIFPDAPAPGEQPRRTIRVRAQITPASENVNVYLRSFDVDDSSGLFDTGHGADNLGPEVRSDGVPKEGRFETSNTSQVTLQTNAQGVAVGTFVVTMQPGDNFRIAATTKQEVASRLTVDKRNIKDPQNGRTLTEENAGTPEGETALMSKLLTVWRYLHVEVDSMTPPPNSDQDPERNFIQGTIASIAGSNSEPERLNLVADPTTPPLVLRDRSPDLDGVANPNFARRDVGRGNGRFERGTIRIGTGAGAVTVQNLDGNGIDYVRKEDGMRIPFRLVDRGGNNTVPVNPGDNVTITAMDQGRRQFSVNTRLGHLDYAGGTLTVAGVNFRVTEARVRTITVEEVPSLSFVLTDDDQAAPPLLSRPPAGDDAQGGTPFEFMQTSDNKSRNLYAPAYVKPVYDLEEGTAAFNRNVETVEHARQVNTYQTVKSAPDFWVVYLQGAFQPTTFLRKNPNEETGDADPASEVMTDRSVRRTAELGFTSAVEQADGSLTNIGGATVYVETIRDAALLAGFSCLNIVTIHESGHEWGLTHPTTDSKGIMGPCEQNMDKRFIDIHLQAIRRRRQPQGN
jgi:hypothetical protein